MKLSTHSSNSPAIVRGASKVALIHITFVFSALISSLTRLAVFHIFSVFSRSELECTPRQPAHRRSQGHLDIPLDRKKSPTVCLSLIFRWLFSLRNRWGWGQAAGRAYILVSPCLDLEKIRNAFSQYHAALKSFIEQLDEWDDLLGVNRNISLRSSKYLDGYYRKPSWSQRS